MNLPWLMDHAVGAAFMAIAAGLIAWPPAPRKARVAWGVLALVGATYGLTLNLLPANFPSSNFFHYYLGAKYPAPYADTYRLIHAGQGRPQIGMRDLEHPALVVRATVPEQRAYYIDLLRRARVPFDRLGPLDSLAARARDSGVLGIEADSILGASLPASCIASFRRDVGTLQAAARGGRVTIDYGYNGSPFYGLLRQADPMLHRPLGAVAGWLQLAWQLLGVVLLAFLVAAMLGYAAEERLAAAALVLLCVDFAHYALPGLIFTELWVPVVLAAWAMARGRWWLAGVAIALAGLVKLFPFVMLLAVAVPLLRSFAPASRGEDRTAPRVRALRLGLACVGTTLALGWASVATGRDWTDFLHKIVVEFQSQLNMANSVGAAALLVAGGVSDRSPLLPVVAVASLAVLAAMFWGREDERFRAALARRGLVLTVALGWVARSWLNYYVVVPFLLLPWVARRHRAGAASALLGMTMVYALPDYGDPGVLGNAWVHVLKLLPFVAIPAWLVWLELREGRWSAGMRRLAMAAAAVLALATAGEIWRQSALVDLRQRGDAAIADSDGAGALACYDRVARLDPGNATCQRKRAIALAILGRMEESLAGFDRAVKMAPDDAAARDDYARALMMAGRTEGAATQLERAHALAPADVQVLYTFAGLRAGQGRRAEAAALLERARELAPDEPAIGEALKELGGEARTGAD
jgi:Flp pilus assembly protein TadD